MQFVSNLIANGLVGKARALLRMGVVLPSLTVIGQQKNEAGQVAFGDSFAVKQSGIVSCAVPALSALLLGKDKNKGGIPGQRPLPVNRSGQGTGIIIG